jgi:hypothetical protein
MLNYRSLYRCLNDCLQLATQEVLQAYASCSHNERTFGVKSNCLRIYSILLKLIVILTQICLQFYSNYAANLRNLFDMTAKSYRKMIILVTCKLLFFLLWRSVKRSYEYSGILYWERSTAVLRSVVWLVSDCMQASISPIPNHRPPSTNFPLSIKNHLIS